LRVALTGESCRELKYACNKLIKSDLALWQFEDMYDLQPLKLKHIDVIEVTPGVTGTISQKVFGGRLNCPRMQDLPYDPDLELTDSQMDEVNDYCGNDLQTLKAIYLDILPQIELRRVMSKKYGIDLLSKSDAQIAEAVIKDKYYSMTKKKLEGNISTGQFYYEPPEFVRFKTPILKEALSIVTSEPFVLSSKGKPAMPEDLTDLDVKIGQSIYKMGMGGLHSKEKSAFYVSNEYYNLYDWDVTSFYPSIILMCNLFPKHIGEIFLDIFEPFVIERVEAKAVKNIVVADSFKTLINGTFGKLGQPYSAINAPELMVQVTVTGQLVLLMLIEMMESRGLPVVSGNTDGIVVKCPVGKETMMRHVVKRWEAQTGFTMECNKYAGLYSRDVNNYLAFPFKFDKDINDWTVELDKTKQKGMFRDASLSKNPENDICTTAMIEYILRGTPFKQTIHSCFDITKFITVKAVRGGGVYDGKLLGKAVRWYHAKGCNATINCKDSGNQVGGAEGVKPLMQLPKEFPKDVDYDWYEHECSLLFFRGNRK
jgi:hypothetical protein